MEFAKAIQVICDGGVDFVVIGGLSAIFHGAASMTYVLDICYSRESANLRRLTAAQLHSIRGHEGFPLTCLSPKVPALAPY